MSLLSVVFIVVVLGTLGILILSVFFSLGYFVIYRKLMKGQRKLMLKRAAGQIALLAYIFVVLAATLLLRTASDTQWVDLQLFGEYRSAWYNFSFSEWRNIVLNIGMFLPFGVLIPSLYPKLRSVWKITAICLVGTLLIETTQLITRRGIFATDDILHNVLGGIIGYGLFRCAFLILKNLPLRIHKIIIPLLPLLVTVTFFCGIYAVYHIKEYGIVTETYINRINMENVLLSNKIELSNEPAEVLLYKTKKLDSSEQAHAFADQFFSEINASPEDTLTTKNGHATYFYAKSSSGVKLCLGIRDYEISYTYEDFSASEHKKVLSSEEEIRKQLSALAIQVPNTAEFSQDKNGQSCFDVIVDPESSLSIWGYLKCESYDDGTIKYVENNLVPCYPLKTVTIISEQSAYEQIEKGMFRCDSDYPITSLYVKAVELTYCKDTKGFLQPAYCFRAEVNGQTQKIIIPAM